jgi:hypothetical protein
MDKLTLTDEQAADLLAEEPELAKALVEVMRSMEMDPRDFDKMDQATANAPASTNS